MRFFFLISFFLLYFFHTFSQDNHCIKFESYDIYLGVFKQNKENIQTNFIFTNECELETVISKINVSSGLRILHYSKYAIPPGTNGIISIAYNQPQRIGKFTESIMVYTNVPNTNDIELTVSGEIIPKDKTTRDQYQYHVGNLYYKNEVVFFEKIYDTETRKEKMFIYNNWDKILKLEAEDSCRYIEAHIKASSLEPGEEGEIVITYNAYKRKDYGIVYDTLWLRTNDETDSLKPLVIKADIFEDFSVIRESRKNISPKISFSNTYWDFGLAKEGEELKHVFEIKNKGIRQLHIRKMDPSCSCISILPKRLTLRQQKTTELTVYVSTKGYVGKHKAYITVISNDPENPRMKLYIHGEIQ